MTTGVLERGTWSNKLLVSHTLHDGLAQSTYTRILAHADDQLDADGHVDADDHADVDDHADADEPV